MIALVPPLTFDDSDPEIAVLGSVLLRNEALDDVAEIVVPEDFGGVRNRLVFGAMLALAQRGERVDVVTVPAELAARGCLDDAGGLAYVAGLDAFVPAHGNAAGYARLVHDRATRRKLTGAGVAIVSLGRDGEGTADECVDAAEKLVFDIAERRSTASTAESVSVTMARVFADLERRHEAPDEAMGLPTGLVDLDTLTCGLHGGEFIVVAARPSLGKTAFALGIATHVVTVAKKPALVFSLEMSKDQLVARMLASEGRVDAQRVRTGRLDPADFPRMGNAAHRIHGGAAFEIDDASSPTVLDIRARARRMKAKHGLALVVVDYLQLIRGIGGEGREQQVSHISRALKGLARELDVPVIALSQLNRKLEERSDKRPLMSDLRESGSIEQDADVVIGLYREEVYNKKVEAKDKGVAEVIVLKQRNGPVGTVRLAFHREHTRFENLSPEWR